MTKHKCLKCGYEWESKLEMPKACPACKSYRFNEESRIKKEDKS